MHAGSELDGKDIERKSMTKLFISGKMIGDLNKSGFPRGRAFHPFSVLDLRPAR
jgi:hypothetical protein